MRKALLVVVSLSLVVIPARAIVFNIEWVDQGSNPVCSISLTPEDGEQGVQAVGIYEDVDGLKKISAALEKFTEWNFKAKSDNLGPVSKQIDEIKGVPFRGGNAGHLTITFDRRDDGTNHCVFVITNGVVTAEIAPAYKAFIKKAWIDNLIKEATDPGRIAKVKQAEEDLK